jgi:hypothetical protein
MIMKMMTSSRDLWFNVVSEPQREAWYSSHSQTYALSEVKEGFCQEEKSSLDLARIKNRTLSMGGQCLTPNNQEPLHS